MSIKRITISVPSDVAARIKKAAGRKPVSAWITELVESHLDEASLDRAWEEFVRDAGVTAAEWRRADGAVKRLTKGPRRGAA